MQNDVTLRSGVTVLSQGQPAQGPAERPLLPRAFPFANRMETRSSRHSPRAILSFSRAIRRGALSFSHSLFLSFFLPEIIPRPRSLSQASLVFFVVREQSALSLS